MYVWLEKPSLSKQILPTFDIYLWIEIKIFFFRFTTLIALGFSGVFHQFSVRWFRGLQVCSFRKCSLCCITSAMACAVMFLIDKILNRCLATLWNIWGLLVYVKDGSLICTLCLSGLRCRSTHWLKLLLTLTHVCF